MGSETSVAVEAQDGAQPGFSNKKLGLIVGILLLIGLLMALQSGQIPLPAPKAPAGDKGAAATAASSDTPPVFLPDSAEPDYAGARQALAQRALARKAAQTREFTASDDLGEMDPDAAALLLAQWQPSEAAALLLLLPDYKAGPILEAATPATVASWLAELRKAPALPPLDPKYLQLAQEAGLLAQFPDEPALAAAAGLDTAAGGVAPSNTTTSSAPGATGAGAAAAAPGSAAPGGGGGP